MKPVRIQRSRQHKMVSPNGLLIVCVTRPSRWGNKYKIGYSYNVPKSYGSEKVFISNKKMAVDMFYYNLINSPFVEDVKLELKDKNLACWCSLQEKNCHGDTLLEIANA